MKMRFRITNITCEACIKLSENALKKMTGVVSVKIGKDGAAEVESSKEIAWPVIREALARLDKKAELI